MYRIIFFICFTVSLFTLQVYSQNFERISNKEGFNQNTVNAIEQDKYGFLWYATPNGLIRYDGYEFKTFSTQSKSEGSISSNNITYLFNDKDGILWIGTSVGVNIYVPWLERFFTVPLKYNIDVNKIDSENDGFVWISSSKELIRCKLKEISKGVFDVSENILDLEEEDIKINTFSFGLNNSIILGTNHGLKKVDYQSKNQILKTEITNLNAFSFFNDKEITEIIKVDNIFWIGTIEGLYNSNLDSNSKYLVKKIKISDQEANFHVNSIFEDNESNIWVGTIGDGLYKYNPILNTFSHFNNDPKDKGSISSHQINAIYQDNFNVLWVGTAQGGINKLDLFQKPFYSYTHNPYNQSSISDNLITSILEDNKGKIWVSGYNEKLFRSTDAINESNLENIKFEDIQERLPIKNNDIIRCIYQDKRNYIWFGTDKKVIVYSPIKNEFKEIEFLSGVNKTESLSTRIIAQINATDIVLSGNKVIVIENPWLEIKQKSKPKITIKSSLKIEASRVLIFLQDSSSQLWFGTDSGLLQCNYKEGNITVVRHYQENKTGSSKISSNRVFTLYEDNKKNIWIGTFGGGLNKLTLDSDNNPETMDYFRKNDVLPDDAIYGILSQNNSDNLWISTDMGLVRFNKETNQVNVFDVSDGLFQNNFRQSAYAKGNSGLMYFGGLNGLTIFDPNKIFLNKESPKVLITSLLLGNKPVKIGEKFNDIVILNKAISETDTITFSKSQRIISFNLVAEHTAVPTKNKIAYKLEGLNKDWVEINKGKSTITYTNLSAGTYQLKIKSANGDGIWSWVKENTFLQGAKESDKYAMHREKPAHYVSVDGFYIDETEVTNKQFKAFVEATNYVTIAERPIDWEEMSKDLPPGTPNPHDSILQPGSLIFNKNVNAVVNMQNYGQWWTWKIGADWKHPQGPDSTIEGQDDYPVVHVAYEDALAFCKWANRRLPTEAEWEAAAQGTNHNAIFTWGNNFDLLDKKANTWQGTFPIENNAVDGFKYISPVKSYEPNSIGIFDMSGNVWEMTSDYFNSNYYNTINSQDVLKNPQGAKKAYNPDNPYIEERVIKGGSFLCHASYCASFRISAKMGFSPDSSSDHIGFRTVATVNMLSE